MLCPYETKIWRKIVKNVEVADYTKVAKWSVIVIIQTSPIYFRPPPNDGGGYNEGSYDDRTRDILIWYLQCLLMNIRSDSAVNPGRTQPDCTILPK